MAASNRKSARSSSYRCPAASNATRDTTVTVDVIICLSALDVGITDPIVGSAVEILGALVGILVCLSAFDGSVVGIIDPIVGVTVGRLGVLVGIPNELSTIAHGSKIPHRKLHSHSKLQSTKHDEDSVALVVLQPERISPSQLPPDRHSVHCTPSLSSFVLNVDSSDSMVRSSNALLLNRQVGPSRGHLI